MFAKYMKCIVYHLFSSLFCNGKKKYEAIEAFVDYHGLYRIWNFVKRSTGSTYASLKEKYPKTLLGSKILGRLAGDMFRQSRRRADKMGARRICAFLQRYCEAVFKENYDEMQRNYERLFVNSIQKNDGMTNLLDLDMFDDMDRVLFRLR